MSREDVLQAMQRTAYGNRGSWNCPLIHTDHRQQQCRKNEDDDSSGVSGVVSAPTLLPEANRELLFVNNSPRDGLRCINFSNHSSGKPKPLTQHVNHHTRAGFTDDAPSSCTSKWDNFRVTVALQQRVNNEDENCLDTEITSTATDGHTNSLWDVPLVHTDHISKVLAEVNSSTEIFSSSRGDHRPPLLLSLQCRSSSGTTDHYPPSNEQEELGEYLGIKEANKGQ